MIVILTTCYSIKYTITILILVWSVVNNFFWKIKQLLFFDTSLIAMTLQLAQTSNNILLTIKNNSNIVLTINDVSQQKQQQKV